ncbi:MAG: extracellular solute-binding protein [Trueperaceae bacterium]
MLNVAAIRAAVASLAVSLLLGSGFAQRTQLELWTFIDPSGDNVRSETLAHVIDTFEVANPSIDVVANVIQWQELDPSLLRASRANRVPDVAMLYSPSVPPHIAAGTLMPLTDYLAEWSQADLEDTVILPQSVGNDGTVYGLPWEMRVSGIMYRADQFEAAGRELPRSLQELREAAVDLSRNDLVGVSLGFSPKAPSISAGWFLATLLGMGAEVINADGTAAFATPEAEELVEWVHELVTENEDALPQDVALLGNEEAQQIFVAGNALMLPSSSQRLEFVRENSANGDQIQMMSYPTFELDQPAPALVQSWSAVIPRGAENPDEAWAFIEHWTSTEMQVMQATQAGYIPVRRSALEDPWFESDAAAAIIWAVEYAAEHPMDFDFPEDTNALYDVWARMFERVLTGQMTAEEGLAWAESQYNQRIGD